MTTNANPKASAIAINTKVAATAKSKPEAKAPASSSATITLDMLCRELKLVPREARMILRTAAKNKNAYPNLNKGREPRAPWQWAESSNALDEARKALLNPVT